MLKQSNNGLRATSDAVLLASAVQIKKKQSLLDVGAGNGVIGLCVNARIPCCITSIEYQPSLAKIIHQNALLNHTNIDVIEYDLFSIKDPLKGQLFNHVVTNPPFYDNTGKGRQNNEQRLAYRAEFDLKKWLDYCLKHLKSMGSFSMIHRPEMLGEILSVIEKKLGKIEIFPIQTKLKSPATRIIIRGILGAKTPLKIYPPLIMHTSDGKRSDLAEKILRDAQPI